MPKNKVVCTGLPDLAFFGHEFHIIGIFGNFFVQICHFSKITLYFATDSDPDRTEFCIFSKANTIFSKPNTNFSIPNTIFSIGVWTLKVVVADAKSSTGT